MKKTKQKQTGIILLLFVLSFLLNSFSGFFELNSIQGATGDLIKLSAEQKGRKVYYKIKLNKDDILKKSEGNSNLFLTNEFSQNEVLSGDILLNEGKVDWQMIDSSQLQGKQIASFNLSHLVEGDNEITFTSEVKEDFMESRVYTQIVTEMGESYDEKTTVVPLSDEVESSPQPAQFIGDTLPLSIIEVSTWQEFKNAIASPSTGEISLTTSISKDNSINDIVSLPSKNFVIHGNGNWINFNNGSATTEIRPGNGTSGSLTFSNVKINTTNIIFNITDNSGWNLNIRDVTSDSVKNFAFAKNNTESQVFFYGSNRISGTDNLFAGFKKYHFINGTNTELLTNNNEVISSTVTQEFRVEENAKVDLIQGATGSSTKSSTRTVNIGSSSGVLVDIAQGGTLNVSLKNTYSDVAGTQAPFGLNSNGAQTMNIQGTVNITSANSNGLVFGYGTTGDKNLTVSGKGALNINCIPGNNATEYAALSIYGINAKKLVNIIDGGKVNIETTGYRAMSLAGGNRTLNVSGEGSVLNAKGHYWALANELPGGSDNQSTINISNGGKAYMTSEIDSTIYTVAAKTDVNVDGAGSELYLKHGEGLYSAYFSDGVGDSNITVTNGGFLDAYTKSGRRAGIDFQSQNTAKIYVAGYGIGSVGKKVYSQLNSVIENTDGSTGDYSLAAIGTSYYGNKSLIIEVKDEGILLAKNYSNNSPTIDLGNNALSKVILDNPRAFDIRNEGSGGRAIGGYASANGAQRLSVANSGISVWHLGKTPYDLNTMVSTWYTTAAPINAIHNGTVSTSPYTAIMGQGALGTDTNNQFKLQEYGRLFYENPEPFVTIDQNPPIGEDQLLSRIDKVNHNRTDSMTEVNDQDTVVRGTAYTPSTVFADKVFPMPQVKVKLYARASDGSIATNAQGQIIAPEISEGLTDHNGNYSITIPEQFSGTSLVAQVESGSDDQLKFSSVDAGESNDIVWNKKQVLLYNDTSKTGVATTEATPIEVYKYTKTDNSIGLKIQGKSAKRISSYGNTTLNSATINVYKLNGTYLGSIPLNTLDLDGNNTFDIDLSSAMTSSINSGDKIYLTLTDDTTPVDSVKPHRTDKAYAIVKSKLPEVNISKTIQNESRNDGLYYVGDQVKYTIQVENTSVDSIWNNVVLSDVLPSQLTFKANSITVNGVPVTENLSNITLGDMSTLGVATGSKTTTITFSSTITSGEGTSFTNTAKAIGDAIDSNNQSIKKEASVTTPGTYIQKGAVIPNVVKSVSNKTSSDGKNYIGDRLQYKIVVSNKAQVESLWENILVKDVIPENVILDESSITIDGNSDSSKVKFENGILNISLGNLSSGENKTILFDVIIKDSAAGLTISNTASAEGDDKDNKTTPEAEGKDDGKQVEKMAPVPSIVKSSENTTSTDGKNRIGDKLKYTIVVKNEATENSLWENVVVTDPISNNVTLNESSVKIDGTSAGTNASYVNGTLTVNLGNLANGESKTITFEVTIKDSAAGTTITNTAKVGNVETTDEGKDIEKMEAVPSIVKSSENISSTDGKNRIGDKLKYTIVVKNEATENSLWENVVVTDPISNNVTLNESSIQINGSAAGTNASYVNGTLTVNLGNLANGESKTITFEVTIKDSAAGTTITNTAKVGNEETTDEGKDIEKMAPVPSIVKSSENISSTDGKNRIGDKLKYTIVVKNEATENSLWENVVVTDPISNNVTLNESSVQIDGTSAGSNASYANGTLTVNLGNLANGESKTITFEVTIKDSAAGTTITNTAKVGNEETTDEGKDIEKMAPVPSIVKSSENITSTDGKNRIGDKLKYTIVVKNEATENSLWENVVVTDPISNNVTLNESSIQINGSAAGTSASYVNGTLTVNLGNLANGESKTITFEVTIKDSAAGTTITNTAKVGNEETTDEGKDIEKMAPVPSIVKSSENITSTDGKNRIEDKLKYTIVVKNEATENSLWENVVVTDPISSNVTLNESSIQIDGTSAGSNASYANGTLTVNLGNLANGESKTITFEVTIKDSAAGTTLTNTAKVGNEETTDEGKDIEKMEAVPSIVKSSENISSTDGKNRIGDKLKYTIVVKNEATENSLWENVVVTDPISNNVTLNESSIQIDGTSAGSNASYANGTLTVNLGNLANGESKTITFEVTIKDSAAGTTLTNTAKVGNEETTDEGKDIEKMAPVPSIVKSSENITSTDGKNRIEDKLKYTIVVKNEATENSLWENVVVTDPISSNVTLNESSIQIDGTSAGSNASYANGTLTVNLGNLANGESKTITFEVTIKDSAAGTTLTNTAKVGNEETTDEGKDIEKMEAVPSIVKSSENITSTDGKNRIGDKLKYTIVVKNEATENSLWENVVVTDPISNNVTLNESSIQINGSAAGTNASYVNGTLTVNLGNLANGESKTITFEVTIKDSAAGTTITNTAKVGNEETTDEGKDIEKMEAVPSIVKSSENISSTDGKNRIGDKLKYTIVVKNEATENSLWENVVVTDPISNNVTLNESSIQINGSAAGTNASYVNGTLTVNLGNLANGESKTITFEVTIKDSAAGTTITNTAKVGNEETTDEGKDIEKMAPVPSIVKSSENTTSTDGKNRIGDKLKYTIVVKNEATENSLWENVVVTDPISNNVTLNESSIQINGSAAGTNASYVNGTLTVNLGNLANGESKTITFEVTIKDSAAGTTITNTAKVGNEETTDEGKDIEKMAPVPSIVKSSENTTSTDGKNRIGDKLKYTIVVKNEATENSLWENVVVTDPISNNVTLNESSIQINGSAAGTNASYVNGTLTVNLGNLANGESKTITFEVTIKDSAAGTTLTNTAKVGNEEGTDEGKKVEKNPPVPKLVKSVENITSTDGKNKVGDVLKYTIKASNESPLSSIWEKVEVIDKLPEGVLLDINSICIDNIKINTGYTYDSVTRELNVDIGDISNGETKAISFEVQISPEAAGKTLTNVATSEDVVRYPTDPEMLKTSKNLTNNTGKNYIGDIIEYTLEIKNKNMNVSLMENIKLTDQLPSELELMKDSITINGNPISGQSIKDNGLAALDLGDLSENSTVVVKLKCRIVDYPKNNTKTIVNKGTATAYDNGLLTDAGKVADNIYLEATDQGIVVALSKPSPKVIKSFENMDSKDGKVRVGDRLRYTIVVSNETAAKSVWKDVTIVDEIPQGLIYTENSATLNNQTIMEKGFIENGKISILVGDLAEGQRAVLSFIVTVDKSLEGKYFKNTAKVSGVDEETRDVIDEAGDDGGHNVEHNMEDKSSLGILPKTGGNLFYLYSVILTGLLILFGALNRKRG